MKYETEARQAALAGMKPLSPEATCQQWQALGVTRQTAHRWKTNPHLVPVAACMAAAWLTREGA